MSCSGSFYLPNLPTYLLMVGSADTGEDSETTDKSGQVRSGQVNSGT